MIFLLVLVLALEKIAMRLILISTKNLSQNQKKINLTFCKKIEKKTI